jgi:hypothetical protein
VEPSETFKPPSRKNVLSSSQGVSSWFMAMPAPCGPQCPRHAALHVLESVGLSLIQPRSITMRLPCVQPPQGSAKWLQIQVRQRCQGRGGAVIPAAAHPSAGTPVVCLPQHPWGLFLTASTPLPRTIPEWVSSEQASYLTVESMD